jgi:hypothetical protein
MDLHVPGGMRHLNEKPNYHISHGLYTIPWCSLVAADCDNLLLGGRLISATHLAASSARVMATCAVIGQAVGTGAALAIENDCDLGTVGTDHIRRLQQTLVRDDAFVPGIVNEDPGDLSLDAAIVASDALPDAPADRLRDRWQRNRPELRPDFIPNRKTSPPDEDGHFSQGSAWVAQLTEGEQSPWVEFALARPACVSEVRPIFDSNLTFDLTQSSRLRSGREGMPITLLRDYDIVALRNGETVWECQQRDNRRRNPIHRLPDGVGEIDTVRLTALRTWGSQYARVFAVRIQER